MQVIFSERVNKEDTFNFWRHEFPKEWKITKSGLRGSHSLLVMQILNNYIIWVSEELNRKNKDFKVDNVTQNLLPEVDPMVWLPLLEFSLHSYGESRVSSMVKRERRYGLIGRVRTYTGDPGKDFVAKDMKEERQRTYQLLYSLDYFINVFALNKLDEYLKELRDLEVKNDLQRRNKRWLISVFTEMKKYIRSLKQK